MEESFSVLRALPHGRQTARDRVREHGGSETTNDVATIMATISHWDQHFAVLTEAQDGTLSLRLEVDRAGVKRFYEDRVRGELIEAAHGLKKVQTPWYSLNESIGDVYRMPAGQRGHSRVAVVFPAWTDGIIGEILWEPQFTEPEPDWRVEARIADRLDAFEAAWRTGDVEKMLEQTGDETFGVMRVAEVGGDRRGRTVARSRAELRAAWTASATARITDLALTNRVVTQFYAFASYRVVLEQTGRRVERELALMLPVGRDGRFIGEFSYALEVGLSPAS
jgi:hypothetical protein